MKEMNDKKACYLATLMMKASISTLELFLTSTCRTADSPQMCKPFFPAFSQRKRTIIVYHYMATIVSTL